MVSPFYFCVTMYVSWKKIKNRGAMKPIKNMYLAAAILAYGGQLDRVDRTNPKQQKFVFPSLLLSHIWVCENGVDVKKISNPSLDKIEVCFISKTLLYPPNYSDKIREIKSIIYSYDT